MVTEKYTGIFRIYISQLLSACLARLVLPWERTWCRHITLSGHSPSPCSPGCLLSPSDWRRACRSPFVYPWHYRTVCGKVISNCIDQTNLCANRQPAHRKQELGILGTLGMAMRPEYRALCVVVAFTSAGPQFPCKSQHPTKCIQDVVLGCGLAFHVGKR